MFGPILTEFHIFTSSDIIKAVKTSFYNYVISPILACKNLISELVMQIF